MRFFGVCKDRAAVLAAVERLAPHLTGRLRAVYAREKFRSPVFMRYRLASDDALVYDLSHVSGSSRMDDIHLPPAVVADLVTDADRKAMQAEAARWGRIMSGPSPLPIEDGLSGSGAAGDWAERGQG